ncbi:MAG: glycosyltransferase family 1 protein [Actinomycetota bacterium]
MVRVAIDVGPTHGPRTGVPAAVAGTIDALQRGPATRADLELLPYVVSMRAKVTPPERRLPLPAAVALRYWARGGRPIDRRLGSPDVVHGTNYVVPPSRAARLVSVYDCWFLEHPELAAPDVRRSGAVLRRAVADGATVVTSSRATTARVRQLLAPAAVHTVLLGPPTIPTASGDQAPNGLHALGDRPFILSVSTLERRKNLPTLVTAFERLAREVPDVGLVLAGGRGDDDGAITSTIDMLPPSTSRRVVRIGGIDERSKWWLLRHARALAYPSLDEGFGFPILEAQLVGTPVVASSAGSIPEVAGSAALLSTASDPDALAANLHWVVTDDAMHAKLSRRGTANAARFSWDRTADELHAIYQGLAV